MKLSADQYSALSKLWLLTYKEVQEVLEVLDEQHSEYSTYCGECGKPCKTVKSDFGIGRYEIHGHVGIDRDIQIVSRCCDAEVFTNWELTVNYDSYDEDNYDVE